MKITKTISNELQLAVSQRLSVGDVVRNYKELCNVLGQPVLSSDSKLAQLKEWKRYFDFEKKGHKFIVTNVYEVPLLKEGRSDSIYVKHMNKCILNLLAKSEGCVATFSRTGWYRELGLVNPDYKKINKYEFVSNNNSTSISGINNFYVDCDDRLWSIFRSSLRSLKDFYSLIMWDVERLITLPNGKTRTATTAESKKYLKAKQFAHDKLGVKNMWLIKKQGKVDAFYNLVDEYIYENYGWHGYAERIKVIFNDEGIWKVLSEDEMRQEKNQLKNKIASTLEDKAVKRFNNNKNAVDKKIDSIEKELGVSIVDKDERESLARSSKIWILPDNYIEEYKFLLNYFVRGDSDSNACV